MTTPPPRKPLRPLPPEELRARQRAMGLDENNLPLSLTPEERLAAQRPPAPWEVQPEAPAKKQDERKAAVNFQFPSWLINTAKVLAALAGVATLALPVLGALVALPVWLPFALFVVGVVAAVLTGAALPTPFFGKPIIYGPAAAVLGTVAVQVFQLAESLPDGAFKHVLVVVCMLMAGATATVLPTTKAPPAVQLPPAQP